MGSRRGGNILIALGVVLALIGGGLAFVMTQTGIGKAQQVEAAKKTVLLAKDDLPEGALIQSNYVTVSWPEDIIPPGTVTDPKDVQNKFARVRITKGTPLNINWLAGKDLQNLQTQPAPAAAAAGLSVTAKGPTIVEPEFLLEKGQVLVAVEYPSASALIKAGAIRPGSRVDIIVRTPGAVGEQIAVIFRNMPVRNIGTVGPAKDETSVAAGSLIFAVKPEDALILKYLESMNPDLLLRAAGDTENGPINMVTQDTFINKYHLQRPPVTTTGGR